MRNVGCRTAGWLLVAAGWVLLEEGGAEFL